MWTFNKDISGVLFSVIHYYLLCLTASYAMTYHTIMTNSSSFIAGLRSARALADTLTETTGVTIFPYSVFYVYYEQYLTTVHDFFLNIGLSLREWMAWGWDIGYMAVAPVISM